MKTCTKCQICKPLFSFTKHAKTKDGLRHWCRDCQRTYMQKYKKDNPKIISAQKARYRVKHKDELRPKNRIHSETFRERHREELNELNRQRRSDDFRHREKRLAIEMAYRFRNKIVCAERRRKWANENKSLVIHYAVKRRLALSKRVPNWLNQDDLMQIKTQYQIAKHKNVKNGQKWVVDHIIPLRGKYVSGLHVPQNLQVIDYSTNAKKSNKFDIDKEWRT